jgi:hypothetical protein
MVCDIHCLIQPDLAAHPDNKTKLPIVGHHARVEKPFLNPRLPGLLLEKDLKCQVFIIDSTSSAEQRLLSEASDPLP